MAEARISLPWLSALTVPIIAMWGYPDEISKLEERGRPHPIKPFGVTAFPARIESVLNSGQPEAASVLERECGVLGLGDDQQPILVVTARLAT